MPVRGPNPGIGQGPEHGRRQDRIATKKIDLYLHRVTEPAKMSMLSQPSLLSPLGGSKLILTTCENPLVKFWIYFGLENVLQQPRVWTLLSS